MPPNSAIIQTRKKAAALDRLPIIQQTPEPTPPSESPAPSTPSRLTGGHNSNHFSPTPSPCSASAGPASAIPTLKAYDSKAIQTSPGICAPFGEGVLFQDDLFESTPSALFQTPVKAARRKAIIVGSDDEELDKSILHSYPVERFSDEPCTPSSAQQCASQESLKPPTPGQRPRPRSITRTPSPSSDRDCVRMPGGLPHTPGPVSDHSSHFGRDDSFDY